MQKTDADAEADRAIAELQDRVDNGTISERDALDAVVQAFVGAVVAVLDPPVE